MPKLLLVDGSSYLYRAFHALPDLRTTRSEPTGALHGVLNMLRRLEGDHQATGIDYKAVVFDAKGRTFRDDWYAPYKANRPPMPEDLVRQIAPLHAAIAGLGWPLLVIDGVEADDVIGTLARRAAAQGVQVVVSTGDKDLAQLVGPRIRLVNTMSNEVLDETGVIARFGVPAELIVDYLALVGDSVDNVPGVDKVGPRTAVKWLQQYGSLDGVVAAAGQIGGAVGENLRRALDFLPLARRLLTVRCDLELPLALADLMPRPVDRARLRELFAHYEMRSWLREMSGEESVATPAGEAAAPAASGAPVGVYVWDYARGMTMLRSFWDAALDVRPQAEPQDEALRFPLCRPQRLEAVFEEAGLAEVTSRAIEVPTVFRSFDDYWAPFLGGQGPAPTFLASLDEGTRERIRTVLTGRLVPAADGTIPLVARAWAVRGTAR